MFKKNEMMITAIQRHEDGDQIFSGSIFTFPPYSDLDGDDDVGSFVCPCECNNIALGIIKRNTRSPSASIHKEVPCASFRIYDIFTFSTAYL